MRTHSRRMLGLDKQVTRVDIVPEQETEQMNDDERGDSLLSKISTMRLATVILGFGLAAVTSWLWMVKPPDFPNAWRWTSLSTCVVLGRWFVFFLIEAACYLLGNVLPLDKVAYFVVALIDPLQDFLWFTWVTVMWSIVFTEKQNDQLYFQYNDLLKVFVLVAMVLLSRVISLLLVKIVTAKLNASTFWEQLQTTIKHEMILKRLYGPPIRPRAVKIKSSTLKKQPEDNNIQSSVTSPTPKTRAFNLVQPQLKTQQARDTGRLPTLEEGAEGRGSPDISISLHVKDGYKGSYSYS